MIAPHTPNIITPFLLVDVSKIEEVINEIKINLYVRDIVEIITHIQMGFLAIPKVTTFPHRFVHFKQNDCTFLALFPTVDICHLLFHQKFFKGVGEGSLNLCTTGFLIKSNGEITRVVHKKCKFPTEDMEVKKSWKREARLYDTVAEAPSFAVSKGYFYLGSQKITRVIVLDYFPRGLLSDEISRQMAHGRALNRLDVQKWVLQLVKGLSFINEKNIIHGGLRVDNCYLDRDNNIFLGDLDFASHSTEKIEIEIDRGAISCISPEKVGKHAPYSYKADIYTLSLMIHRLLFKSRCIDFDWPAHILTLESRGTEAKRQNVMVNSLDLWNFYNTAEIYSQTDPEFYDNHGGSLKQFLWRLTHYYPLIRPDHQEIYRYFETFFQR